ncbi:MAG: hypothetical protein V1874_01550 [Spirochaetota bacterium]
MNKRKIIILLVFIISLSACQDYDVTGKIVIEYDNAWTAVISQNRTESNVSGNGNREYSFTNPDSLSVTASKQDDSQNKLTVFIYEDERITAAASTREPQGSVRAEYEFPY